MHEILIKLLLTSGFILVDVFALPFLNGTLLYSGCLVLWKNYTRNISVNSLLF